MAAAVRQGGGGATAAVSPCSARWASSMAAAAATSTSTSPAQQVTSRTAVTPPAQDSDASAVAKFVDLGLPRPLARQLIASFPHILGPTLAQTALLDALPKPNDIILRAHTGTGKSFSLLLGLLAKPRVLFARPAASPAGENEQHQQHGIASIVVVPSNELAFQYYQWAQTLLPQKGDELHPIIQVAVRGHPTIAPQEQIRLLRDSPPHLLVATPTRLVEILSMKTNEGTALLGLSTLRTLALDEADALLDLPGRFPTHKLKWKHTVHPAPALIFLNEVMRLRPSCSGGQLLPSAGLEREDSRFFDERRPPEAIRRTLHRAREAISKEQQATKQAQSSHSFYSAFNFSLPRPRYGPTGSPPVQLVVTSATANAVLRHFFGARTGWLRTGVKEAVGKPHGQSSARIQARVERTTGLWLDLTGLTKASLELTAALTAREDKGKNKTKQRPDRAADGGKYPTGAEGSISERLREEARKIGAVDDTAFPRTMPEELTHYCIVVDEPGPDDAAPGSTSASTSSGDGDDAADTASSLAAALPPMRNLDPRAFIRPYRKARDLVASSGQPDLATTVRSVSPPAHEVDPLLLSALAFAFASDSSSRALALIPPQWSLRKAREVLEGWGVPVRTLDEDATSAAAAVAGGSDPAAAAASPVLYLLQATSARGLDLPVLSHVFIVGVESIGDSVRYTHLAGRASRIGPGAELTPSIPAPSKSTEERASEDGIDKIEEASDIQPLRPLAKVVTLLRGLPHASVKRRRAALQAWARLSKEERIELGRKRPQNDAIMVSSAERKLWTVWRRTGVTGRKSATGGGMGKWDLRLVGGEAAVEEEAALADWDPEEEARAEGWREDEGDLEDEVEEDEEEVTNDQEASEREYGRAERSVSSRFERPGPSRSAQSNSIGNRGDEVRWERHERSFSAPSPRRRDVTRPAPRPATAFRREREGEGGSGSGFGFEHSRRIQGADAKDRLEFGGFDSRATASRKWSRESTTSRRNSRR
ncbi:hypothetical protein OC844_001918 [Tilletia horrida]|nr:hypothetical protein OC844_001918 [Tilletia horrida]